MQNEIGTHRHYFYEEGRSVRREDHVHHGQIQATENWSHTIMVPSERTEYEVVKPIMETARARYYLCRTREGEQRILSIAATIADNKTMKHIADVLRHLEKESAICEVIYRRQNQDDLKLLSFQEDEKKFLDFRNGKSLRMQGLDNKYILADTPQSLEMRKAAERKREIKLNKRLHYDWLFPALREQFAAATQNRRMTHVLESIGTDSAGLIPLEQIVQQNLRVDLKTSAQIIGHMLKLLGFLAQARVHVAMSMPKFLLNPEDHHIMLLDWSDATICRSDNLDGFNANISRIGECGLRLIGASYDDHGWEYPYEHGENVELEDSYIDLLYDMALLKRQFYRTHDQPFYAHWLFYQMADEA